MFLFCLSAFLQLYTWYQKGKVRWQLVMQQHFLQVIADIIVIAGILMIGYLLFYGIYYKHSIAYLATNIKVNDVSSVFWQMVKQQTIIGKAFACECVKFYQHDFINCAVIQLACRSGHDVMERTGETYYQDVFNFLVMCLFLTYYVYD